MDLTFYIILPQLELLIYVRLKLQILVPYIDGFDLRFLRLAAAIFSVGEFFLRREIGQHLSNVMFEWEFVQIPLGPNKSLEWILSLGEDGVRCELHITLTHVYFITVFL